MQSPDLFEISRELSQQHQPHAWITVISVTGPSSSYVGAQAIVRADGELNGWIGGGCVQSAARAAALRSIASAVPQRLRLSNTKDPSEAVDVRPMACASNGEVELFIQPTAIAPRLRIYGNTPIVRVAAWLAREMDFDPLTDVEAADVEALTHGRTNESGSERETYALVATQGDGDEASLEKALRSNARAVLVVASRRKTERLRLAMELRAIPKARLDIMYAPAGPDIGAITPNEIALAAVAGLVALRRGRPAAGDRNADAHAGTKRDANAPAGTNRDANALSPHTAPNRRADAHDPHAGASRDANAHDPHAGASRDADAHGPHASASRDANAHSPHASASRDANAHSPHASASRDTNARSPHASASRDANAHGPHASASRDANAHSPHASASRDTNAHDPHASANSAAEAAIRRDRTGALRPLQPVTGYINPVCGAVVDPKHALSTLTMAGQTHYFCCQGCRTEFERDPQKYLEIAAHMREPARTPQE